MLWVAPSCPYREPAQVQTQEIRKVTIMPTKTVQSRVLREARATPALALLNDSEDPALAAGLGSDVNAELFAGVVSA